MKRLILLFAVLVGLISNAQQENPSDSMVTEMYYVPQVDHWYDLKLSLGVYPEIQFINSPVIGVSASYARLLVVEWSAFGRGVNVGFEFDPLEKFYGPKVTLWGAAFALFLGGNISVSTMYYFQDGRSGLYLRPEIGIGIPRIHLKYGFGFRALGDELTGIQRHSLTLGCHFTLFKYDPRVKVKN